MKLPVTMYRDEDDWFVAECPVIPGCMSQGRTAFQTMDNIREAIGLCLEARQEQGLSLIVESREVELPVRRASLLVDEFIDLL
ncbi:MAG TPA: type II toxin-antitoxin system HicB family antitoxin [Anaerolineae bacterium]|nr:type II toxin-antitoxin system HicB family antitoxin [Anaerolineae bacterium]